jgi:drug/metabolite transporter (DMT)-like permease
MPPVSIAFFRLTFSFLLLLPFFIRELSHTNLIDKRLIKFSFLASIFLSLHFLFWISSLQHTSVTSSVVLVTTNPLFVGIFSVFLLKERIARKIILSILLVLLGGIIISYGENITERRLIGNLLALLGAIMASLYIITGRKIRQEYSLISYTTILYLFTSVILLLISIISGIKLSGYSSNNYLLILFLAIVPQLLGHNSFNYALKYISPTIVSILILFEPIGATIISYFMSGYIPSTGEIIGSSLILLGIFISII